MGNFNLEEGINNMLVALGNIDGSGQIECSFYSDELKEFNPNMDNVIRSNNIERGQNNILSGAAGASQAQAPPQQP